MPSIPEEAATAELVTPSEAESPETLLLIETGNPGPEPSVPAENEISAGVRVLLQDNRLLLFQKREREAKKERKTYDIRRTTFITETTQKLATERALLLSLLCVSCFS